MATGSTGTANVNPASSSQAGSQLTPVSGANLPPDNLNHYSPKQLIQLAAAAGFSNAALAAAIAMAESSGNPNAVNQDSNGTHDVGLWQINSVHGYSDAQMKNPYYNVAAAKAVFDGSGWGAWSTVNDDMSKVQSNYYITEPIATQMGVKLQDSGSLGGDTPAGLVNSVAPIGQAAGSGFSSLVSPLTNLIGDITSGKFWIMVLKILAGVILIGVGLYMLVKGSNG